MRLDHLALRVRDRAKTAQFFINAFGYHIQEEFDLQFDDGTTARCVALEPPEKAPSEPWVAQIGYPAIEYHMAPEIFISSSEDENSIVGQWVKNRGGVGGLHHIAYMVDDVEKTMSEWRENGYAEFATEKPMECEGIKRVFSKPSELTGFIIELISRNERGFCSQNVARLMESTKQYG